MLLNRLGVGVVPKSHRFGAYLQTKQTHLDVLIRKNPAESTQIELRIAVIGAPTPVPFYLCPRKVTTKGQNLTLCPAELDWCDAHI